MSGLANDPYTCLIGFSADAFDSAADHYRLIEGWVAEFKLTDGTAFDGTIGKVSIDDEDGQYKVSVAKWNEEAQTGDPNDIVVLDIYDDISHIRVI